MENGKRFLILREFIHAHFPEEEDAADTLLACEGS